MAAREKEGITGPWTGLGRPTWAGRPGPIQAQPEASFALRRFPCFLDVPPSTCRSMSSVFLRIGHNSLSCKIQHFSGQVLGVCCLLGSSPWLLGVKFASMHDLYGASRSCHKVLDELIPKVLLSTLKPCINTKLQNRHAHVNLYTTGVSTNG
jgi:hypothetical protein